MMELAGREGSGVIYNGLNPYCSPIGMKLGLFKEADDIVAKARAASGKTGPFKRIGKLNFSVSRDGNKARDWAKRNTSYALTQFCTSPSYRSVLSRVGVDCAQLAPVVDAYIRGVGIDEGARRLSDDLLDRAGFVIAGTPDQILRFCEPLLPMVKGFGFDQLVVGVPLGPDIPEAIDLLAREVVPVLTKVLN
jgi:hypothetical protein